VSSRQWSTNLTVRTQVSAFLAGIFFSVLWFMATRQEMPTLLAKTDLLTILTLASLTITFAAFAFSTFAFGLSADFFRKATDQESENATWENKAKTAFYVGCSFFKLGYFFMMLSLTFVLAQAHVLFGIFGFVIFVLSWIYLVRKTGPYVDEKKKEESSPRRNQNVPSH
jgi:hypothetical protein